MARDIEIVINNHLPEWKQIIKEVISNYNNNLKIEIEISEGLEFNANVKSTNNKDEYTISINKGVFKKIYEFYHSVLKEENPRFVQMAKYPLEYSEEYSYDEGEAKTLADFYVYLSLKFVFLHELGHIMNGHLAYLNSKNQNASVNMEMNNNNAGTIKGISAHQYQMLEIDADAFAATNLLVALLNCYSNENTYIDRYKSIIPTRHHLVLFSITANIISMSLQGLGAKRYPRNLSEARYIPMRMRLNQILGVYVVVYKKLTKNEEISVEIISELVTPFEKLINQYLVEIGYYDEIVLSEENNLDELNEETRSHVNHLYNDVWPVLKRELINFAYVKSLA